MQRHVPVCSERAVTSDKRAKHQNMSDWGTRESLAGGLMLCGAFGPLSAGQEVCMAPPE